MWWENAVFYEIYIPSFADSDGDGIGDIEGIRSRLSYLKAVGIDAIWLTPFYPSPKVDNGYDVSDYCAVDPQYGSLEQLIRLIEDAHQLEIKIIIDVVFNHTSTNHPWFIEAASSKESLKRDWYIWRDSPNNWESFFGGSAWSFDEITKQYYYHSFAEEQADLNWQNKEVKQAILQVIQFWLERGVDGFRFDVINNLTVNDQFSDNPIGEDGRQIHRYDVNQSGIMETLKELNEWIKEQNPEVFTVAEISSDHLSLINSYTDEAHFDTAFHFNLGSMKHLDLQKLTKEFQEMSKQNKIPTLFFNSHDMSRSWNRLANNDYSLYQLFAVFVLINRGISFLFQGEEQGAADYEAQSFEDIRDIQAKNKYRETLLSMSEEQALLEAYQVNRDRSRGMIAWNNDQNAGWIGIGPRNPEANHILTLYKQLIQLRKAEGPFQTIKMIELQETCLSYRTENLHIILNFGKRKVQHPLQVKMSTLFGRGMLSTDGNLVQVPPKACWIGKEHL